jgi:hypothetical protein
MLIAKNAFRNLPKLFIVINFTLKLSKVAFALLEQI